MAQDVAHAHQQDEAWFKPIYEEMSHGGLEAMLYDLLAHDLGDWRPRQIVRTAALGRQMDESLSPFDQWWRELLLTGVLTGSRGMPNTAISNAFEEEIEEEETVEGEGIYGGKQTRKRKRKSSAPACSIRLAGSRRSSGAKAITPSAVFWASRAAPTQTLCTESEGGVSRLSPIAATHG